MNRYRIVEKTRFGRVMYMPQHKWAFIWWNMSAYWFHELVPARNYIKASLNCKPPTLVEYVDESN